MKWYLFSTAPHRRSGRGGGGGGRGMGSGTMTDMQPSSPTMHENSNFTRGIPGRNTYAYGTHRPPPVAMHHFVSPDSGDNSQSGASSNSGFFKRLIPTRFSRRYRGRYFHVCILSRAVLYMIYMCIYTHSKFVQYTIAVLIWLDL